MRKKPLRKCLGCNSMKDKKELIRVVKNNEDAFFIDQTGKMNGRGAYICPTQACLQQAIKNKGLEKSFKMQIPNEIYDALIKELELLEES